MAPQVAGGDFSLLRLIEGIRRDGNPAAAKRELGLVELQRERGGPEVVTRIGVPLPDQQLLRDLGTGGATSGSGLVTQGLEALVAAARPALQLEALGAQVIAAPGGRDFNIPTWNGELASSSWIVEGSPAPVFSGLAVKSIALSAHGCAARVAFSRRLAASAAQALEPALMAEMGRAVRSAIEQGLINGTGSAGQLLGLLNTPGIGVASFAAALPTFSELAAMVEAAGGANAALDRCSWLLHPADLAALLSAGSGMAVTWADGAHRIHGFQVAASTHVPEGKFLFGDFSALRIVFFGPPQMIVDTFSNGKSITGETEIVMINYVDLALIEPSHFVLGSG